MAQQLFDSGAAEKANEKIILNLENDQNSKKGKDKKYLIGKKRSAKQLKEINDTSSKQSPIKINI